MTAKGLWKWLRKHEKKILAAIVVLILPAFGFGGILVQSCRSKPEERAAVEIDGRDYSFREIQALKRRFFNLVSSYMDYSSSRSRQQSKEKVTNEDIFKHIQLVREAEAAGIRVSDKEIDDYLRDYSKVSIAYPHISKANQFLSSHELLVYTHTIAFQVIYHIAPQGTGYSEANLKRYLGRFGLKKEQFRKTIREIMAVLKY
ncbi:MAG: SurA N-terminal domain-containing protein, partial [Planctomycetota bacterium]